MVLDLRKNIVDNGLIAMENGIFIIGGDFDVEFLERFADFNLIDT